MHLKRHTPYVALAFLLALLAGSWRGLAGDVPKKDDPKTDKAKDEKKDKDAKKDKKDKLPKPGELKKYEEVITEKAKTQKGVFTVHRIEDKVYFEIPDKAYGKYMLWMSEVAKAPAGVGWGGLALGNKVVRWERRGNKVFLWGASFAKRADGEAVLRAVESADHASIYMSFNVETENKAKEAVINATALYTTDVADLSVKAAGGGGGIDQNRSYIDDIKSFPTNIETRSLLTFTGGGGGFGLPGKFGGAGGGNKSATALVHYSLTLLPDKPMQGRFFDPRVGYFTRSFEDYSTNKAWMSKKQYIARFRLEKKNPNDMISEPVKPIVFYLSREIPEKWRPYMKKGVEDWKPAFEQAGFKNAIICKNAPSREEDPNWDPEDARYSVIRWVADPFQNAMGPHVHDPRSGEVISAHIIFWHGIQKLVQQWYFVQCAASDPRARQLPLPDDLTGELMRYVAAHEVGHTLGLRHNHRASSAYTIEQLRDPKFCQKNGTVASIMAYGRFNYVAQPEDKVKWFIPKIGPYDRFAIEWGYKGIAGAKSAEAERSELDKWAARQIDDPWLRFGGEDGPATVDPTVKTENIGLDSLQATALGLKNLERVLDILIPATTKLGEDFDLLKETYAALMAHRRNWLNAVALNVGGVVESRTLGGRGTESFTRVSKEKQQEAVKFLIEHGFTAPKKLLQPAIVNRIKYVGVADDLMAQQRTLLTSLLSGARFRRMLDAEVLAPDQSYSALQFLSDVQDGVWSELKMTQPAVDAIRRNLQRSYLEHLKGQLSDKGDGGPARIPFPDAEDLSAFNNSTRGTDFRAVARAVLQELLTQIDAAINRSQDLMTRVHLRDCRREVDLILNPKN